MQVTNIRSPSYPFLIETRQQSCGLSNSLKNSLPLDGGGLRWG